MRQSVSAPNVAQAECLRYLRLAMCDVIYSPCLPNPRITNCAWREKQNALDLSSKALRNFFQSAAYAEYLDQISFRLKLLVDLKVEETPDGVVYAVVVVLIPVSRKRRCVIEDIVNPECYLCAPDQSSPPEGRSLRFRRDRFFPDNAFPVFAIARRRRFGRSSKCL